MCCVVWRQLQFPKDYVRDVGWCDGPQGGSAGQVAMVQFEKKSGTLGEGASVPGFLCNALMLYWV